MNGTWTWIQAGLLILTLAHAQSLSGDCKCRSVSKHESTRWGGNEMIVQAESGNFRKIEGTVQMGEYGPLENALVEVFDHPEYLLKTGTEAKPPDQHRLRACLTSADGRFCFENLPSGKYELRSSINSGWDVTHIYVVVSTKVGEAKKLTVEMHLGT